MSFWREQSNAALSRLRFPLTGTDYPSMIMEVSPREFRDICDGKPDLGDRGWMIGKELNAAQRV